MTAAPSSRAHLIERAMAATGGIGVADPPGRADRNVAAAPVRSPLRPAVENAEPPATIPQPSLALAPGKVVGREVLASAGLVIAPVGTARNRLSEEFAVVQHQLLRTMRTTPTEEGRSSRIILVTSARPGEGKTFTSLNIAGSIAAGGGLRVVLVDADGKRNSVSDLLGCGDEPGLRRLVAEPSRRPADLLVPTALDRLLIMPYGHAREADASVPPGAMLAAFILRLAAALPDAVLVVDSPPCLSTSDPGSLASIAGQVLLVVEAEKTQRNEVEAALDMVDACSAIQLLLNRAQLTGNDSFGHYGYGEYGAYGSGPNT